MLCLLYEYNIIFLRCNQKEVFFITQTKIWSIQERKNQSLFISAIIVMSLIGDDVEFCRNLQIENT